VGNPVAKILYSPSLLPFHNHRIEMANTIKVLFRLHKSKTNALGAVPLMLRLTYQNRRTERATGFYLILKN